MSAFNPPSPPSLRSRFLREATLRGWLSPQMLPHVQDSHRIWQNGALPRPRRLSIQSTTSSYSDSDSPNKSISQRSTQSSYRSAHSSDSVSSTDIWLDTLSNRLENSLTLRKTPIRESSVLIVSDDEPIHIHHSDEEQILSTPTSSRCSSHRWSPSSSSSSQGLLTYPLPDFMDSHLVSSSRSPSPSHSGTSSSTSAESLASNSPEPNLIALPHSSHISWRIPGPFHSVREESAKRLLKLLDDEVFGGRFLGSDPVCISLEWNNRFWRTAGVTRLKRTGPSRQQKFAAIELAEKIIDNMDRLYETLAHEMCHAAAWIIDNCLSPPHGVVWKSWVKKVEAWDNEHANGTLRIGTYHEYQVQWKYWYACQKCSSGVGRFSKSVNTERSRCGSCGGKLVLEKGKRAH